MGYGKVEYDEVHNLITVVDKNENVVECEKLSEYFENNVFTLEDLFSEWYEKGMVEYKGFSPFDIINAI